MDWNMICMLACAAIGLPMMFFGSRHGNDLLMGAGIVVALIPSGLAW